MDKWIYFWHQNCSPCKANKEYVDKLSVMPWFQSVNVLDDTITANEHHIRTVPTLIRYSSTGTPLNCMTVPSLVTQTLKLLCNS